MNKLLEDIAGELSEGNIDADPCGSSETDNTCAYCEFASACHFMDGAQMLHARGPMGLKELTSYKYQIYGNGQIRG